MVVQGSICTAVHPNFIVIDVTVRLATMHCSFVEVCLEARGASRTFVSGVNKTQPGYGPVCLGDGTAPEINNFPVCERPGPGE